MLGFVFGLGHTRLLSPSAPVLLLLRCCTGAASSVMGCRGSQLVWTGLDELQISLLEAGGLFGSCRGCLELHPAAGVSAVARCPQEVPLFGGESKTQAVCPGLRDKGDSVGTPTSSAQEASAAVTPPTPSAP